MFEANIDFDRLADLLHSQDESAYEFVVECFAKPVIGRLVRMGFSHEDAKDIWGDCLLKIWASACETYDPSKGSLLSWLVALARNIAIDRLRANKKARLVALREAKDLVANNGSKKEGGEWDWELVEKAILSLSASDQDLIELKFGQGLTYTEISAKFGISTTAAGVRVTRAVSRLRDAVERLTADELQRRNKRLGKTGSS